MSETANNIPKKPFNSIALSLSGGGYRATAFHLGTVTYLSEITFDDQSLLSNVSILSTVSGGSFLGTKYASCIKKGESLSDCYKALYNLMVNDKLLQEVLDKMFLDKNWNPNKQRNLINVYSEVYNEKLFSYVENQEKKYDYFGDLWTDKNNMHLKEIIFNATEFNFGLPFRFQKTEPVKIAVLPELNSGVIGNYFIRVNEDAAKECRMADIVASSSCFPAGFEPILFPNDFIYNSSPYLKKLKDKFEAPIGLMDGGIADNQGIESVILAEKRMHSYENISNLDTNENHIDLFIISDVCGPFIDDFLSVVSSPKGVLWNLSFHKLKIWGWILLIGGLLALLSTLFWEHKSIIILSSILGVALSIFGMLAIIIYRLGLKVLPHSFSVPKYFMSPIKRISKISFGNLKPMIINRWKSVLSMVSDVFMKQIRNLSYDKIYESDYWKNRRVTNTSYELATDILKKDAPTIYKVAQYASTMPTTLWFEEKELQGKKEKNRLHCLIATGQFTICFNLKNYVENLRNEPDYNQVYEGLTIKQIDALYAKLSTDWNKFKENPFWMLEQMHKELDIK